MDAQISGSHAKEAHAAGCPIVRIGDLEGVGAAFRSKNVLNTVQMASREFGVGDPAAESTVNDFNAGMLIFQDGVVHRERRKMLNRLLRPEQLINYREQVVLPSLRRVLVQTLAKPDSDGFYRCDLLLACERIFINFSAKLIGLVDADSPESIEEMRHCLLGLMGANMSAHYDNRQQLVEAGIDAKKAFVKRFFEPTRKHYVQLHEKLQAGMLNDQDLPTNLMWYIVTNASPDYADLDVAQHEAFLMFIATVGTSAQAICWAIDDLTTWFRSHPEDLALRSDSSFLSNALQETLRLKAPFFSFLTREAAEDGEVAGQPVRQGQEIRIQLAQAHRRAVDIFGEDAEEYNPHRSVPEGVNRYGLAFGSGPHQCYGLRVVLGNDGTTGSHLKLIEEFIRLGVERDVENPAEYLSMADDKDELEDIVTFTSYPVVLRNWKPTGGYQEVIPS
jgi:cytochrome P450